MIKYPIAFIALIYLVFFGLVGFALWLTHDPWVLAALIFTPSYKEGE